MNLFQVKSLIKQHPGQFYTYLLKRPDGTPFYVGKGNCKGFRIGGHRQEALSGKSGNPYKCRVIRKIWKDGEEIDYDISFFTDSEEDAFDKEMELINFYGRKSQGGILVNLTDGGEGQCGWCPSPEYRAQRSLIAIKNNKIHDQRGELSAWWGKHHTKESNDKRSKSMIGKNIKKHTDEHNRKIKLGLQKAKEEGRRVGRPPGFTQTDEHNRKASEAWTGEKNPNYGNRNRNKKEKLDE